MLEQVEWLEQLAERMDKSYRELIAANGQAEAVRTADRRRAARRIGGFGPGSSTIARPARSGIDAGRGKLQDFFNRAENVLSSGKFPRCRRRLLEPDRRASRGPGRLLAAQGTVIARCTTTTWRSPTSRSQSSSRPKTPEPTWREAGLTWAKERPSWPCPTLRRRSASTRRSPKPT